MMEYKMKTWNLTLKKNYFRNRSNKEDDTNEPEQNAPKIKMMKRELFLCCSNEIISGKFINTTKQSPKSCDKLSRSEVYKNVCAKHKLLVSACNQMKSKPKTVETEVNNSNQWF